MSLGEVTVFQRDILTHGKRQSQDKSPSTSILCVGARAAQRRINWSNWRTEKRFMLSMACECFMRIIEFFTTEGDSKTHLFQLTHL